MVLWLSKIQFTYVIDIKEIPDTVSGPSHLTKAIFDFLRLVLGNVLDFLGDDNVLLIFKWSRYLREHIFMDDKILEISVCFRRMVINVIHHG